MTGVNYRKIRHYAPGIRTKQTRLDPDISAILFKAGVRVTSSTERLIADLSVKAAMPGASSSGDSDGKKRGLESERSSRLINDRGMVYDPNGKKEPGTYLKLHVTEPERKAALMSADPVPNWGWVKKGQSNTPISPAGVKVSVTRYKLDPRTGNPIKSTGHDPFNPFAPYKDKGVEVKGLGKTIGESSAGGKLINFAARAAGVVVDALGKFRCPPGTPAANRFTNERGEGCFAVGAAAEKIVSAMAMILTLPEDDESILGAVTNLAQSHDRVTLVESLLQVGIPSAKIREAYKRDGMMGLASLASAYSELGGPGHLVGEKYLDPSYRGAIAPTLREAMRLTDGRVERMARIAEETARKIEDLKTDPRIVANMASRGISFTDDEEDNIIKLLEAISEIEDFGLASAGHEFYVGGTKETHQKFLRKEFFRMHGDVIAAEYGSLTVPQLEAKFEAEKGTGTPFARAIEAMMERDSQMRIGAFERVAIDATSKPEQFKDIKVTTNPRGFTVEHGGGGGYAFSELNGMAGGEFYYIGSGPAVQGWRGAPPEGSIDIYEATGGLQEQQWAAIAAAIHADETGRYWAHTFSTDLAAMHGRGWRDFGAQAASHESYHLAQILSINRYVKTMSEAGLTDFTNLIPEGARKKKLEEMTNEEMMLVARAFLSAVGPEHLRAALGADIEDLIDRRLDGVAGKYSGNVQQDALQAIRAAGAGRMDPKDANQARGVALLETITELAVNRDIGLIGNDPELDSFIDKVYGPTPPVPGSIPSTPGGSTAPDGPTPDIPDGAPTPSTPGGIGPMWWDPSEIEVVVPTAPTPRTPSGGRGGGTGGGGGGRHHDPFGRRRSSLIAKAMREGYLTTRLVEEMIHGKREVPRGGTPRPGGLLFNMNNVLNGRLRLSPDLDSAEVTQREQARKIVKQALGDMGLTQDEVKQISDKILKREILSSDEESKLVGAITKLWEKQREIQSEIKRLEAKKTASGMGLDRIESNRLRYLERASRELGQSFIAPINDLWEVNEFHKEGGKYGIGTTGRGGSAIPSVFPESGGEGPGPYMGGTESVTLDGIDMPETESVTLDGIDMPETESVTISEDRTPRYREVTIPGGMASSSRVSKSQNSKLSPGELETISRAVESTPSSSVSSVDKPGYGEDAAMLEDIYKSYGIKPQSDTVFDDTETVVPVLKIIDKSEIDEEIIAELEIDESDYEIGSIIETEGISNAEVYGRGFASSSRIATGAGVAGRILNSRAARKAMEKMGIDPENEDLVSLAAETAIAFSAGGPAAALIPIARRGGRDAAEKMLGMMLTKGWISPEVAEKVRKYGLDRIAKEGLPDEIIKAINDIADSVNTEDNKASAIRMVGVLQERASELRDSAKSKLSGAKGKVSGMFGKSAFDEIDTKVLGPGLREKPEPEKKRPTGKKQKVRVVVPPGSKAKVEESGDVLMPPGKMKVTGFGEDGVAEAEITEQVSAADYMKKAEEKLAESMKKTTDERVKKLLSESAEKYKKSRRDLVISSSNYSSSGISKATLEKAEEIIASASQMGYALFNDKNVYINGNKVSVEEYYDTFLKSIRSSIKELKEEASKDIFPDDKELNRFLKSNSEDQIYKVLLKIAGSVFGAIDRRARVSMTKSSLQEFLTSGKIANIDVDSKMLSEMKKNRDKIIGGSVSSREFSLTPVELMHESNTKRVEQNLFMGGTRVGSEEFADYGRGIELVIRSENSKRIGYGRADSEENEGFYSLLTDDGQQRIMMTIFGNVIKGGQQAKDTITSALYANMNKDYRGFLRNNGEDLFEGFIVGEISLNDIEHIKIPLSIFDIENKPVSKSHQIGGKKRVSSMLKARGMTDAQINDFFDKGGMIGGGYNPKYLTYLLQAEAAQELKDRLISFGLAEVIFTNKNGIDIMAEQTWIAPPPYGMTGIRALRQLAKMEVNAIIEKTAPQKDKKKAKEKVAS